MTYSWLDDHTITKKDFESLDPFAKGYWVYLGGTRKDQPNIPAVYVPDDSEKEEYEQGQMRGVISEEDNS